MRKEKSYNKATIFKIKIKFSELEKTNDIKPNNKTVKGDSPKAQTN